MVLKYHPDKRKSEGALDIPKEVNLHEYFTCITKAFEQLSSLEGRQAFDSVDPTFDETTPSTYNASKQDFFKTFQAVFERNSRLVLIIKVYSQLKWILKWLAVCLCTNKTFRQAENWLDLDRAHFFLKDDYFISIFHFCGVLASEWLDKYWNWNSMWLFVFRQC